MTVHLTSFQSPINTSILNSTSSSVAKAVKSCVVQPSCTNTSGFVNMNSIMSMSQPPKPPERSCSFKDVDNLQQQTQQQNMISTNPQTGVILASTPAVTADTSIQSKRQRSLTTKDPSSFCLKSISNGNGVPLEPLISSQLRPLSRVFNNNTNTSIEQTIKNAPTKLETANNDLQFKNGNFNSF